MQAYFHLDFGALQQTNFSKILFNIIVNFILMMKITKIKGVADPSKPEKEEEM